MLDTQKWRCPYGKLDVLSWCNVGIPIEPGVSYKVYAFQVLPLTLVQLRAKQFTVEEAIFLCNRDAKGYLKDYPRSSISRMPGYVSQSAVEHHRDSHRLSLREVLNTPELRRPSA